jgi:uncharacterized coiled-coil DUF342 family protein
MDTNTIIQGIILLGAGGITPYLVKVESRLKRLETKQEQNDIDGQKLDLLFTKIAEVKDLVMNVKSSLETHAQIDKIEKGSILTKIQELKNEIESSIDDRPENHPQKTHRN